MANEQMEGPRPRQSRAEASNGKNGDIIALLDEAIASIPSTDLEIAVARRYGTENWKERLDSIREKILEARTALASRL